jgi:ADP-dependent phosphofructokinase/glucokinase
MQLPSRAIFAFNANLDHVKQASDEDLAKIEDFSPKLFAQMDECFSWGVQKEVKVDAKACEFFLGRMEFDSTVIGGQAGNGAEQASALGVECLVQCNFANDELSGRFSHKDKVLLATENGFVPACNFSSNAKSAHHFVFEHPKTRTRFIASYDPVPLHPDDSFCRHIGKELPSVEKAFVGGMHLVETKGRVGKFAQEIARWKQINPGLEIFFEMGEFSSKEALEAVQEQVFPMVDMVGLNEVELAQLGLEIEELSETVPVLFHTQGRAFALPSAKEEKSALSFAEKCASFLAKNKKHGALAEIESYEGGLVESPMRTVGIGDTFSCAYFMSAEFR